MKTRLHQSEQLDNLSLKGEQLNNALSSLGWINKWLGNHQMIIPFVLEVVRNHPEQDVFRIVDLGCGGGDVLLSLAKKLRKEAIPFSITGIDGNKNALKYAESRSVDFPQINYLQADILSPDFVLNSCDILISSHFLYHFDSKQLVRFFNKNLPKVKIAFINSGLERTSWALRLFKAFIFFLPLSRLAKEDGLIAIQRAFTRKELAEIINQVPAFQFQLMQVPLFRLKLVCFRSV